MKTSLDPKSTSINELDSKILCFLITFNGSQITKEEKRKISRKKIRDFIQNSINCKVSFCKNRTGRTKIRGKKGLNINFSYSGKLVCVVLGKQKIQGCDIERDSFKKKKPITSFLRKKDNLQINKNFSELVRSWTIVEASLKSLNKGILQDINKIKIIKGAKNICEATYPNKRDKIKINSFKYKGGYWVSVAQNIKDLKTIRKIKISL